MEIQVCKLKSVEMTNFKRHAELDVAFSEGLTTIVGPNYIGKTTVAQAIFFALFGVAAMPGGSDSIVRWGERSCSVELALSIGDKDVVITRTLTTAKVIENGVLVANGPRPTTEWCEQALGGDMKTILRLSRSGRGEATSLIEEGATKLNRFIEEAHNLGYIDGLIAKSTDREKKYRHVFETLTEVDTKPFVERLEEAKARLLEMTERFSGVQQGVIKATEESNSANTKYNEVKASHAQGVKHANLLSAARSTHQIAIGKLKALEEALGTAVPQAVTNVEVLALRSAWMGELAKVRDNEAKLAECSRLTTWVGLQEEAFQEHEKAVKALAASKDEYDQLVAAEKEACSELGESIVQVRRLELSLKSAVCSACNRPFDAEHEKAVREELARENDKRSELHLKSSSVSQRLLSLGKIREATGLKLMKPLVLERYHEGKATLAIPLEMVATDAESASKAYEDAKAKCDAYNVYTRDLAKVDLARKELANAETALSTLEVESTAFSTEADLYAASSARDKADALLLSLSATKTGLEADIKSLTRSNEEAELAIRNYEAGNAKKANAERRAARFKGFTTWLRTSRATFVQDIWQTIMFSCSEFVRTVTNGAISEVVRTDADEFRYVENGVSCSVEGSASGAQLCDIGIGLRLALSESVPSPIGFMFLDEPSAEMSSEHAAMLTGALRATGKQIIVTSHREGDQAVSDSTICLS